MKKNKRFLETKKVCCIAFHTISPSTITTYRKMSEQLIEKLTKFKRTGIGNQHNIVGEDTT